MFIITENIKGFKYYLSVVESDDEVSVRHEGLINNATKFKSWDEANDIRLRIKLNRLFTIEQIKETDKSKCQTQ